MGNNLMHYLDIDNFSYIPSFLCVKNSGKNYDFSPSGAGPGWLFPTETTLKIGYYYNVPITEVYGIR